MAPTGLSRDQARGHLGAAALLLKALVHVLGAGAELGVLKLREQQPLQRQPQSVAPRRPGARRARITAGLPVIPLPQMMREVAWCVIADASAERLSGAVAETARRRTGRREGEGNTAA